MNWPESNAMDRSVIPNGLILAVSPLLLGLGCTEIPATSEAVVVTDSAGVTVVYATRPTWTPGEEWTIHSAPKLSIGTVDGPDPYQFFSIGYAGRLPDGGVWIAHTSRPPGFRVFDGKGVHVRSMGSEGEGPGEFRVLSRGWLAADGTLIGYDSELERVTRYTLDGVFLDSHPLGTLPFRPEGGRAWTPRWLDRFSDGRLLGQPNRPIPTASGRRRARYAYTRLDLESGVYDTIALALGPEYSVTVTEAGSVEAARAVVFSPSSVAIASDSTVFLSDTRDFWIEEVGAGGQVLRRFGRAFGVRKVTAKEIDEWRARRLATVRTDVERRALPQRSRGQPFAETLPVHDPQMLLDAAGNLWVALRRSVPSDDPAWSVFDQDGIYLGDVRTPARLRITEITEDEIVGVWQDELGVQSVRVYDLVKPRREARRTNVR